MYKLHTHCRACGYAKPGANGIKSVLTEKLLDAFDLGVQPLANDFRKDGEARAGYAPLKVLFCPRCSLAQLSVVVDPEILYSHYSYVTSKSDTMKRHFDLLWAAIAEHGKPKSVLEIGSNDGDFLAYLQQQGVQSVMGVDPADNLSQAALARGINTVRFPFSEKTAAMIAPETFDCIVARHVFCHVDDWPGFIRGCELLSHENTTIVIEAPYGGNTLKNCEFDQVYHEHLSFITLKAMHALLENSSFQIADISSFSVHGGTCVFFLKKQNGSTPISKVLGENITLKEWQDFGSVARDQINRLSSSVRTLRAQGKTVAGLGASAKSTVWVNACGFTRSQIAFIADNTPQKQLTTSPGSDIPIVDEGAILRELPDYVVLFAWNYRDEILEKFALARSKGVKFIIPVPKIEFV